MAIPKEEKQGLPDWLVTYTDLMSLLVVFFVLLLTFSTPKREKLYELRGSISGTFGIFTDRRDDADTWVEPAKTRQGREQFNPYAPAIIPRFRPLEEHDPNAVIERLRDQTGEEIAFERINAGYRVRLAEAIRYAPGELQMTSASFARMRKVARALAFTPYHIVLVAHVEEDDLPYLRRRGQGAEDFALRRAVALAERLTRRTAGSAAHHDTDLPPIHPEQLGVAGYGPRRDGVATGYGEIVLTRDTSSAGGIR